MESKDIPLAPTHIPKGRAAGSLRTIRSRYRTFQRDMMRGVSGLSASAMAPSKGTFCGES